MLGMPILDVALGMVFLYLLLSLVCSSVMEFFAGLYKKRATFLTEGIIELLDDPGITKAAQELRDRVPTAQDFYDHPLIRSLYRTVGDGDRVSLDNPRNKPSYIPARTFALTLIDLIAHPNRVAAGAAKGGTQPQPSQTQSTQPQSQSQSNQLQAGAGTSAGATAQTQPVPRTVAEAASQGPAGAGTSPGPSGESPTSPAAAGSSPSTTSQEKSGLGTDVANAVAAARREFQQISDAVDKLPEGSHIKRTLQVLLTDARGDVEKFQANVEIWYNHAMDRVSGWYKRWSQFVIFGLALVVSVAANADTITIGRELSTNSALRQAVTAQAEVYAKKPDAGKTAQDSSFQAIRTSVSQLNDLGISLGWAHGEWQGLTPGDRLLKVMGLLLTAFAVSLGAPFWFDMLNKIITIRAAGKSPEDKPKSPEGGPKRKEEAPPE